MQWPNSKRDTRIEISGVILHSWWQVSGQVGKSIQKSGPRPKS